MKFSGFAIAIFIALIIPPHSTDAQRRESSQVEATELPIIHFQHTRSGNCRLSYGWQ
jgi:hypothetical protein